jgi:hypothetical protein
MLGEGREDLKKWNINCQNVDNYEQLQNTMFLIKYFEV